MSGFDGLEWENKHRGWWEAIGSRYSYRAVQVGSLKWTLYVFEEAFLYRVAELEYPETLSDCKHYAAELELGRRVIRGGRSVKA